MLSVIARLVADAVLVGVLLFSAAGTLAWGRGWVLVAVLLFVRAAGAGAVYRVNPALLRDRAKLPIHADQSWTDRLLLFAVLSTGLLGVPVVAALDAFRWHVLPTPAPLLEYLGLALFAAGWGLKSLALRANAFATAAVRLQRERAHAVVDSGVYRVVRHPFYAADPLIMAGAGLWLGSYVAVVFSVVPMTFLVVRLCSEERFLRRELPGYREYTLRVRHRLIPGVW
ncbi:MAG TPA: isoprenylcysteine carboxylmethyltransferase family protein [Longimicrobium sp.]|jgi:protein-S-isoprenylcysteine O-methyltransferase Ste14